jgi:hypothetical protein
MYFKLKVFFKSQNSDRGFYWLKMPDPDVKLNQFSLLPGPAGAIRIPYVRFMCCFDVADPLPKPRVAKPSLTSGRGGTLGGSGASLGGTPGGRSDKVPTASPAAAATLSPSPAEAAPAPSSPFPAPSPGTAIVF